MLAVASATPSMRPMMLVLTPSTLDRKSGRMFSTISLETSMKKAGEANRPDIAGQLTNRGPIKWMS